MKPRELAILLLVAGLFYLAVASLQHAPGYMDADYYYAGGLRLAQGHGFSEMVLWNYLDNPQSLPHPSHGYWFPLASMVAAAGMWLSGAQSFFGARMLFLLIAALVAPATALLAFQITQNRQNSLVSGLLAVFSGYYVAFLATTDNFGILMLLGALFFFILANENKNAPLLLGLVSGLINLARADGALWFGLGLAGLLIRNVQALKPGFVKKTFPAVGLFILAYLLVMGPWMLRNLSIWGTPLTAAGGRVLWLTSYEDTFSWPADQITMQHWLAGGWSSFWGGWMNALRLNILSALGVQAAFWLLPLILVGLWQMRSHVQVRLAVFGWAVVFVVMTFVFPFAGSRGSFFHAGAAFQPVWFILAAVGLDKLVSVARARGRFGPAAPLFFRGVLVVVMALLSIWLVYVSVVQRGWNEFSQTYQRVEQVLLEHGARATDVVMVPNSPGYFVSTGRSAIIIPDENLESVHALARVFGARFLVLEKNYFSARLQPVYLHPENQPGLHYLIEFDGVKVYEFLP